MLSREELWRRSIDQDRRDHEQRGDAMAAWRSFLIARLEGYDVPEWTLAYLTRVAIKLVKIHSTKPSGPILAALEFVGPGAGSVFTRRSNAQRDAMLADD